MSIVDLAMYYTPYIHHFLLFFYQPCKVYIIIHMLHTKKLWFREIIFFRITKLVNYNFIN